MNIGELKPGERAVITQMGCTGRMKRRLLDMGVTPGVEVEMLRAAPFGDPICYLILGYRLSIRKKDASKIQAERFGSND